MKIIAVAFLVALSCAAIAACEVEPRQLDYLTEYTTDEMSATRFLGLYECTLNVMEHTVKKCPWLAPYYEEYKSVLNGNAKTLLNCVRNYRGEKRESCAEEPRRTINSDFDIVIDKMENDDGRSFNLLKMNTRVECGREGESHLMYLRLHKCRMNFFDNDLKESKFAKLYEQLRQKLEQAIQGDEFCVRNKYGLDRPDCFIDRDYDVQVALMAILNGVKAIDHASGDNLRENMDSTCNH